MIQAILIILGVMFLYFGYNIFFKKKYHLINDFEAELKAGRKTEKYAERIGIIEFVIGVGMLIGGILLIII